MAEFEVGGQRYAARRMDARTAFHVARKLLPAVAPFVAALGPAAAALAAAQARLRVGEAAPAAQAAPLGDTLAALAPLARVVADLPTEDVDFIIEACLRCVSRSAGKGGGWSAVWNEAAGAPQFDDIGMSEMLAILAHVIRADLAPFIDAPSFASSGAAQRG